MAKIDKSKYTKEQWRLIRDQRRADKEQILPAKQYTREIIDSTYIILCIKHGPKYSSDYVNKLYNGVKRHCTKPFKMVCLTDDTLGINPEVETLPLPHELTGWWCKPYMFSKDLPLKGTVLYLDLDVVIAGNIDKLFDFEPGQWCVIRDFTRAMRKDWPKYNSSVIRFQVGQLNHVWERFRRDANSIMRRLHGDQDWLYEVEKGKAKYFVDRWILSWKWEIRKDKTFAPGGIKGERKLAVVENCFPPPDCSIAVFHGDPNPHNCEDPWVVDNWK